MAPTTPRTSDTVFGALAEEWRRHSRRPRIRKQIRRWSQTSPELARFSDGDELVAAAERDRDVLAGLARVAATDEVAMTATLVALTPRLRFIANVGRHEHRRTGEASLAEVDRHAMVVSIAHGMVLQCHPDDGSETGYDWRLKCNITRRYRRWLARQATGVDAKAERLGEMSISADAGEIGGEVGREITAAFTSIDPETTEESDSLSELAEWVAQRAATDFSTAELVVLTRCGGVTLDSLVATRGTSYDTLNQRRWRAERRLVDALGSVS